MKLCTTHGVYAGQRCPSCPQGGRRRRQHAFRSTAAWQAVAKRVRARDGNRCTYGTFRGEPGPRCTVTHPGMPVHHITPVEHDGYVDETSALDEANCRCLCTAHHNRIDAERRNHDRGQEHQGPTRAGTGNAAAAALAGGAPAGRRPRDRRQGRTRPEGTT